MFVTSYLDVTLVLYVYLMGQWHQVLLKEAPGCKILTLSLKCLLSLLLSYSAHSQTTSLHHSCKSQALILSSSGKCANSGKLLLHQHVNFEATNCVSLCLLHCSVTPLCLFNWKQKPKRLDSNCVVGLFYLYKAAQCSSKLFGLGSVISPNAPLCARTTCMSLRKTFGSFFFSF